jgi:hypothetical protein
MHCGLIPATDIFAEWLTVPAFDTMMQIVCRTSNRLFVGLPLCRDPDFIKLNVDYAMDVIIAGQMINMLPYEP